MGDMKLSIDPNGVWYHGSDKIFSELRAAKGYLYRIDEPIAVGHDVYQHPRTVMDENAEFLTKRPLKVKLICEL